MAIEIRTFAVKITAGTPQATPSTTDISFPDRIVRQIDWKVPPGPQGKMGFRFASGGVPFLPSNNGAYVVTDDQAESWVVDGQISSGAWQLQGYNTGANDHTVYVTFHLDLPPIGGSAPASMVMPLANTEVI